MGTQNVSIAIDPESRKKFLKHLLHDVEAFDYMMANGLVEKGKHRIGAEQEFCLVNSFYKPSMNGPDILEALDDPMFTTELARFNLEINLLPEEIKAGCFNKMEDELTKRIKKVDETAAKFNDKVILTGILPSIDYQSVQLKYLTPRQRYAALDEVLKTLRDGDFELNITGVDELIITHNNILFEACNTSFQCHYQVQPNDFAEQYNWAQAIAGPVLAICANSPLLMGKQLWAETRIPLFQQSIDTRGKGYHLRERQQRVTFGNKWISEPGDVYKSDIARHPVLFLTEIQRDSMDMLQSGEIPELSALNLHNGTVYKWNRPCFGVHNGIAHVRIENRYIASGPTIIDEIANLAFWTGLMKSMPDDFRGADKKMSFEGCKENFQKAAMWGIQSGMVWNRKPVSAQRLILDELLPMAENGLKSFGISDKEIKKYLTVIEHRAERYQTGARWSVKSFRKLREFLSRDKATVALTAIMHKRRISGLPVCDWETAAASEIKNITFRYENVGNVMTTDLITATEHDLAELILKIMEWRNIRHLPVEDKNGKLKGIIFKANLTSLIEESGDSASLTAHEVMQKNPLTVSPDMDIRAAVTMLTENGLTCLPVVDNDRLVGLITNKDAKKMAANL